MTTTSQFDSAPADIGRLRWRCRRGTRELDTVLDRWLSRHYADADAALREDFAALLDTPDPDLWNWLIGQEPAETRFVRIVDEIRFSDRV